MCRWQGEYERSLRSTRSVFKHADVSADAPAEGTASTQSSPRRLQAAGAVHVGPGQFVEGQYRSGWALRLEVDAASADLMRALHSARFASGDDAAGGAGQRGDGRKGCDDAGAARTECMDADVAAGGGWGPGEPASTGGGGRGLPHAALSADGVLRGVGAAGGGGQVELEEADVVEHMHERAGGDLHLREILDAMRGNLRSQGWLGGFEPLSMGCPLLGRRVSRHAVSEWAAVAWDCDGLGFAWECLEGG